MSDDKQVRLMAKPPYPISYLTIFYSFFQNHILNTNFYQLHPSHRRDAYEKHLHWTAAFRNKIWYIWVCICLEFNEKAKKTKKKYWEAWNANEKANKMKKAFCFDICSWHYLRQNLSTPDLRFSPSYLSRKKGNLENISQPRPTASASKTFFSVSFFLLRITREKLKSDVDKLCLRRAKNKYRNKILFLVKNKFHSKLERDKCSFSITVLPNPYCISSEVITQWN